MTNETKQPTLPEAIALAREALTNCEGMIDELRDYPVTHDSIIEALAALDSLQVGVPVTDHIEDERGMAPVYQIRPDCENWIDCTEKYYAEWKGGKRTLYTQPADCPRCAELSESLNNRAREQAQKTVNDEVSLDKFATLEAELSGLRARYLRMGSEDAATIAQQAERIKELSFDAAMANQAREIGNHFGLTQVWSDTSIASQVIDKMKEQQATIAQQAEQLAAAERDAERYRWLRSNHPIHDNRPFICRNFGAALWTDDQVDKAIDAAIAASREGD